MSKQTERIILIVVLANLVAIAVVGYAVERSTVPAGVLFLAKAGPVAFDHRSHVRHGGPGLECEGCHHEVLSMESGEKNCRTCHYYGRKPFRCEAEKVHKRCVGAKCMSCHTDKECSYCHNP